ncbi:MAG: ComF family protein [Nitrospiraceae bacterium]
MVILRNIFHRLLNLVLPVDCSSCGIGLTDDPVPFFCRQCWGDIRPLQGPACPRCGRPFASPVTMTYSPTHHCAACRHRRPAFTQAWSLYPYTPPLRDAIRLFKYRRKVVLADALGDLFSGPWPQLPELDVVIPVPLHSSRLREREFNQSLLLADRLNHHLRLPLSHDNLVRTRATRLQTELSRSARLRNLRRSFVVRRPDDVAGKRILLVDDVLTTGTTVNECAKALRRAGSGDVYVGTLARAI